MEHFIMGVTLILDGSSGCGVCSVSCNEKITTHLCSDSVSSVRLLELSKQRLPLGVHQPEADIQLRHLARAPVDDLVLHSDRVTLGDVFEEALLLPRVNIDCHLSLHPGCESSK